MKALTADSVVSSSLLGGLFAPTKRNFSGLGSAIAAAMAAVTSQVMLGIKRTAAGTFEVRMVPESSWGTVRTAYAADDTNSTGVKITSELPTGGTKRYAYTSTCASGTGPLGGPLTAGIYSLEDFLNTLADGGFDGNLTDNQAHVQGWDASGSYLVIDQASGEFFLVDPYEATATTVETAVPDAELVLVANEAKWE